MRANRAPKWLARMILHDELRAVGLPFVAEAVAYKPADGWLTYRDTLQAVAVSSAIVNRMRQRIPVGDELRSAAWRCTVAGLGRLPREAWPTSRRDADEQTAQRVQADEPQTSPLMIRRRGEGWLPHAK